MVSFRRWDGGFHHSRWRTSYRTGDVDLRTFGGERIGGFTARRPRRRASRRTGDVDLRAFGGEEVDGFSAQAHEIQRSNGK